jgi:hypothetical protein
MVLIAPGAERARIYDPQSRSVVERILHARTAPAGSGSTAGSREPLWLPRGSETTKAKVVGSAGSAGRSRRTVTISQPAPWDQAKPTISHASAETLVAARALGFERPRELVDPLLLREIVHQAVDYPGLRDELIWLSVAAAAAKWPEPPKAIPDADLFRAIVAVARRHWRSSFDSPGAILAEAIREPLHLDPELLFLIVKHATRGLTPHDVWESAWYERTSFTRYQGTPTPPDLPLFMALVTATQALYPTLDAGRILQAAHGTVGPIESDVWPRNISRDFLDWIFYFAAKARTATAEEVQQAALYMLKYSGAPFPPAPDPDLDLIAAIIEGARFNPYFDPLDVLNEALGTRLLLALRPYECGEPGQRCCGKDLCNGSALCDWDGICKASLWPAPSDYISNQTWPSEELDTDWTEELQGLASDGSFWYVVQGDDKDASERALWKAPLDVDFTADWGDLPGVHKVDALVSNLAVLGCLHWGDPDVHQGRVYVPLEDCPDGRRLAEFDARTLELLGTSPTHTLHAASVDVHPKTREFYIMNHYYSREPEEQRRLYVYAPRGSGPLALGDPIRKLKLEGAELDRIQGIAFSPSGKLYVSADGNLGPGIYGFQIGPESSTRAIFQRHMPIEAHLSDVCSPFGSGEELEGLTVANLAGVNPETGQLVFRHQIHIFLLRNVCAAQDNAWFKHVSVVDRSRV